MKSFDASPLFNAIPSFYRDNLNSRDKAVIAKLWEGMTRVIDAEYSQLFQVSDSNKLDRITPTTLYPWVYQEFDGWTSRGTRHQHAVARLPGSSATTFTFLNRRLDLNKLKIYYGGRRITLPEGWVVENVFDSGKFSTVVRRIAGYTSLPFNDPSKELVLESEREFTAVHVEGNGETDKIIFKRLNYTSVLVPTVVDHDSINAQIVVNLSGGSSYPIPIISQGRLSWGSIVGDVISFSRPLPTGATVRVSDSSGTQSFTTSSFTSSIKMSRAVTSTADVFIYGVQVTGLEVTEDGILFKRPITSKSAISIFAEGALKIGHDHARLSFANTVSGLSAIPIPVTRPLALNPNLTEDKRYPVKVFINGILLPSFNYVFNSTTQITLTSSINVGDRVDVIYVDAEEIQQHAHITQIFQVPSGSIFSAADLPEKVDSDRYPFYVETLSNTYTVGVGLLIADADVSTANNLTFTISPDISGPISVYYEGMVPALEYRTILDPRVDESERYEGTLVSAERLQDGIDVPSKSSFGETLVVLRSGSRTVVESDYAYETGWFVNAQVDEHLIRETLGLAVRANDRGVSDDQYRSFVKALYAALYSGSQTSVIENFACHVLGSNITEAGVNRGYYQGSDGNTYLKVGESDAQLTPEIAARPAPRNIPKFFAVSAHCEVIERNLASIPWLAFIAEALSSDYRYAKRLDQYRPLALTSDNGTFSNNTLLLTDYSVDYLSAEIWVGDLIELTISDGVSTRKVYTRVLSVVNSNQIKIDIDLLDSSFGWGDPDGWGETTGWGGVGAYENIETYTIWCRQTRRKDTHLFTDEMLDQSRALSAGESVQAVTGKLSTILNKFLFAVKIHWFSNRDDRRLADLKLLLDSIKPADTNYVAYTEVIADADGSLISDTITGRIIDRGADIDTPGRYTFIEEDFIGEMFIGTPSAEHSFSTSLYDTNWWTSAVDNINELNAPSPALILTVT